jgi:hypothetical protein
MLGEPPFPGCKIARADFKAHCSQPTQSVLETPYA